jgi:hypothetical protein
VVLLVLAAAAAAVGFALILLIGRGEPVSPAASVDRASPGPTELAWIGAAGIGGFQRILRALFAEMGFAPEPGQGSPDAVEFFARDPTPIRGGRIYVRGLLAPPADLVGAEEVRALVETARGESLGKAVLVTLGRFSAEARDAARDQPVDLLDGDELAALVKRHLPQAYATRNA